MIFFYKFYEFPKFSNPVNPGPKTFSNFLPSSMVFDNVKFKFNESVFYRIFFVIYNEINKYQL